MHDIPYKRIKGGVSAPREFYTSAISCGIKDPTSDRLDLGLIYSELECTSHGMFTSNRIKAAPVRVTQSHMRALPLRAIITNSGNANACTGPEGMRDARAMAKTTAKFLNIKQREVGVCSTGVIGLPLPMQRIEPKIAPLVTC